VDPMTCLDFNSWDSGTSNSFYPFRFEISLLGNILLGRTRLIIPKSLRKRVLEQAYEGHLGETAMKRRLIVQVWWPRIDRDVENFLKSCKDCILASHPLS